MSSCDRPASLSTMSLSSVHGGARTRTAFLLRLRTVPGCGWASVRPSLGLHGPWGDSRLPSGAHGPRPGRLPFVPHPLLPCRPPPSVPGLFLVPALHVGTPLPPVFPPNLPQAGSSPPLAFLAKVSSPQRADGSLKPSPCTTLPLQTSARYLGHDPPFARAAPTVSTPR